MKNKQIIKELQRIAKENKGVLNPRIVVNEARQKSSPIHSQFEWEDSKAAEQYRLIQARELISVMVHVLPNTNKPERIWVSLKTDQIKGGGYRKMVSILSNKELRKQLLEDALADLSIFREKYKHLNELAEIFAAMEKFT